MFHTCLASGKIPLTGSDADLFFGDKVECLSAISGDASMTATARALLGKRVGESKLTIHPLRIRNACEVEEYSFESSENELWFVYFRGGNSAAIEEEANSVRDIFDGYKGFSRVEKVEQYYGRAFKAYAWSNPEKRTSIILTGMIDMRKLHILEACIPVVMPWFFPVGEDGEKFTPDEKALLNSLHNKTPDEYLLAMARIAAQYDFREFVIRKRLDGIGKRFHEVELANIQSKINAYEDKIHATYDQLETLMRERETSITMMFGLKERLKTGAGGSELTDYFLCNKSLELHSTFGTNVEFTCRGYLENWNDDMAESVIENLDSYPYDEAYSRGFSREDFQKFLRALFLDREIKLRVYADYHIELAGGVGTEHFDVHSPELADYMPNPHIENYDCLGDYKRRILECIHGGSVIEAFDYCIASSRSLNWGDSCVMSRFFENVCSSMDDLRCFELPDGTAVAVHQAVEWAVNNT